ncbi:MAG TPA: caspase family protein, partial [Nitrospira sp.]
NEVGVKRALLIGINKYQAVPKLQGSLNDIETMRQVLITKWGFPERNIRLLTDEQATREGMMAALNRFVNETGPLDTVYIHYSGHGSQVADLNGDEPDDKLDETLVPQDGRTGTVPDITDDELETIFGRLRTKNAFIVLDSCHSGTATRSLDIRTRSVPQDTRIDLYRQTSGAEIRTRGNIQALPAHYVLMTGAASHQEALDGPVEGRFHGFFSYSLSKSLSSSSSTASPREIFRGIETELKRIQTYFGRASMPEPQLEAPPDLLDKPLLSSTADLVQATGSKNESRLAWLDVREGSEPGVVTLINGLLLGAAPGSSWAIYPPDNTTFAPGQALAVATVTQLVGQDARAKFHPASKKITDHSRAVALMPAPASGTIPVHIMDVPDSKRKHIEDVLVKYIPNIEVVGSNQFARYVIQQQGNTIQLLAADGLQLVGSFSGDGEGWGTGLALVVSRSATASELLALDNPSSQLKIDVRVVNSSAVKSHVTTRGIAVVAANTQPARYRIRKAGKPRTADNSLQLEVKVNANAYLTIVDVDSEGGINLLFPNEYAQPGFYPEGRVQAGEAILIPDSLANGNKAGFYWDYSPPKGMDTVRIFSSTDLETAQTIRQRIKQLQTNPSKADGRISTRAIAADIGNIRENLANRAVRGIVPVYDPTPHIPGQAVNEQPKEPDMPQPSSNVPQTANSSDRIPATQPARVEQTGSSADWAATSIMITVEG